ncbi:hypothetical protein STEG23_030837, partial [Scotinomys teguina]
EEEHLCLQLHRKKSVANFPWVLHVQFMQHTVKQSRETLTDVSSEENVDKTMVGFVKMNLELNFYIKAVQSTINHVKEEEKVESYY